MDIEWKIGEMKGKKLILKIKKFLFHTHVDIRLLATFKTKIKFKKG